MASTRWFTPAVAIRTMIPALNSSTEPDRLADHAVGNLSQFLESLGLNDSLLEGNQTWTWKNSSAVVSLYTTPDPVEAYTDDSAILAKISLLLVVTVVVLIVSYKFVVRLFLGYADRKDDTVSYEFSDDEDSSVVKRSLDLET